VTLGRYSRDLTNGSRPRHGSPGNADACRGWRLRLRRGLCSPGLEQSGQRSPELSLDCSRLRSVARSPNDRARKSTPASRAEAASRTTMCWRNCRKPAAPTSDAMSPWRRSRPPGSGLLPLQPVENDLGGGAPVISWIPSAAWPTWLFRGQRHVFGKQRPVQHRHANAAGFLIAPLVRVAAMTAKTGRPQGLELAPGRPPNPCNALRGTPGIEVSADSNIHHTSLPAAKALEARQTAVPVGFVDRKSNLGFTDPSRLTAPAAEFRTAPR